MKNLNKYVQEGWVTSFNPKDWGYNPEDTDKQDVLYHITDKSGKPVFGTIDDIDKMVGKDADKNGSYGKWAIDEPNDNEAEKDVDADPATWSRNKKILAMKFDTESDFFIQGEAGWGKTSLIKDQARKHHLKTVTVYLDKIMASDLGGIPIPTRTSQGAAAQELAMPGWAAYMLEHPKDKFLLFFDEMNQATSDVQNALMPIILEHEICGIKFKNFFVGAAGNFESENKQGITKLSGPLYDRFKPVIIWESGSDAAWEEAMNFLKRKYKELDKDVLDMINNNRTMFTNPRNIERGLLNYIIKARDVVKNDPSRASIYDPNIVLDWIEGCAVEEDEFNKRTRKQILEQIAQNISNYIRTGSMSGNTGRSSKKTREMIDENTAKAIKNAMIQGSVKIGGTEYGISRENIQFAFEDVIPTMEMMERLIKKLEKEGNKFRYETDKEFIKDGKKDPRA